MFWLHQNIFTLLPEVYIPVSSLSREAGGFSCLLKGPTVGLRTPSSQVPLFCSRASPPLSLSLLDSLLLSDPSSSSWAFDQSWPLCHSCPSGGSSPSPTTTLPAGRPPLMHTQAANVRGQTQEPTHGFTHPRAPHALPKDTINLEGERKS